MPNNQVSILTSSKTHIYIDGVDFTGALYVQMNGAESKVCICLFTCATTRAIHLEIVRDLSTETFLLALRRFASRKSLPQIIVSDNGSTYLSAAEELKELLSSDESQAEYVGRPDSPESEAKLPRPRPQRRSKEKAREQIASWIKDLGGPEDV